MDEDSSTEYICDRYVNLYLRCQMCPCMREREIKLDVSINTKSDAFASIHTESDISVNMKSAVLAPPTQMLHAHVESELKLRPLCFLSCSTPGRRTCR